MKDCKKDMNEDMQSRLGKDRVLIRSCSTGVQDCNLIVIDGGKVSDELGEIGFSLEHNCMGGDCILRGEVAVDREVTDATVEKVERIKNCNVTDIHYHKEQRGLMSHVHILCEDKQSRNLDRLITNL